MLTEAGLDRLKQLIRKATRARKAPGQLRSLTLDTGILRDIFVLVKGAERSGSEAAWELLLACLGSGNSNIRLLSFKLIDQLFRRSRWFRNAAYKRFRELVERVVQIPGLSNLPEPNDAKDALHRKALHTLNRWASLFGKENPCLSLTLRFLHGKLGAGFISSPQENNQRRQEDTREERTRSILRAQFETVCNEMSSLESNVAMMQASLAQMEESLELIGKEIDSIQRRRDSQKKSSSSSSSSSIEVQRIDKVQPEKLQDESDIGDDGDEFDIDWSGVRLNATLGEHQEEEEERLDDAEAEWEAFDAEQEREYAKKEASLAMISHLPDDFKVSVPAPPLDKAARDEQDKSARQAVLQELYMLDSCEPLLSALKESVLESTRSHMPVLNRWIRVLSRVELTSSASELQRGELLRQALSIRSAMQAAIDKAKNIGIESVRERVVDLSAILLGENLEMIEGASTRQPNAAESIHVEADEKKKSKDNKQKKSKRKKKHKDKDKDKAKTTNKRPKILDPFKM